MITGIQITKTDNAALLNSFGYLMKRKMKRVVFVQKQIITKDKLLLRMS